MTSMLTTTRGDTIPDEVALARVSGELSEKTEQIERLAMSLDWLARGEEKATRITPEQAWFLHYYSEEYRLEGERLLEFAKRIKERSMTAYIDQLHR